MTVVIEYGGSVRVVAPEALHAVMRRCTGALVVAHATGEPPAASGVVHVVAAVQGGGA